jgi:hypothetical protein
VKWWSTSSAAALATVAVYAATHGLGVREALPWLIAGAGGCALWGISWWIAIRVTPETNRRGWRGQLAVANFISLGSLGWGMVAFGAVAGDRDLLVWGLGFGIACGAAGPVYYRWIMR